MTIKIWGITDNRIGHLNQIQSVLELLSEEIKLFILENNILGKLGYSSIPLGVKKKDIIRIKQELNNNVPDILLVIGRRNLSVALYLKKLIKLKNYNVKLIFLMPPGSIKYKEIDLYFIHSYKLINGKSYPKNVIPIDIPPSRLLYTENTVGNGKDNLINVLKQKLIINNKVIEYKRPYIGVLIGGRAKGVAWNLKVAKVLCYKLNKLVKCNGGTLIVTTSRRTSEKVSKFIQKELLINSIFCNYNSISDYNPYIDILTKSDFLVVTGESTSMIADSINLNIKAKVLIFDDESFKFKRFKAFRDFIYTNNYAISLQDGNLELKKIKEQNKLNNSAYFISNTIKNLM